MAVEQEETIEDLWAAMGEGSDPRVSQQYYRPVPGFRDATQVKGAAPIIRGVDAILAPKQAGLNLSISEIPIVVEWLKEPTLLNARRLHKEHQLRNELPEVKAAGRRGTMSHVLYSALRAKMWNQDRGMNTDDLIASVFPTLKPQERSMYEHILANTPDLGANKPFKHVAKKAKTAYESWLEQQALAEQKLVTANSSGWQQSSFLEASPQSELHWQPMRDEFKSNAYQASVAALMSACERQARDQTDQEARGIPVGTMLETMVLDNQKKSKDAPDGVGSLQVTSRFDELIFWRDPKTNAIRVSLIDVKSGRKQLASWQEDVQMVEMAHVVNRFADALVVENQALAGHRQMPAGFVRDPTVFRLTRALADEDWWGNRVESVTRRWLDQGEGVFKDQNVVLDTSTIGAFGEMYGELIEHVGKQKPVLNVLLGRKSAKK